VTGTYLGLVAALFGPLAPAIALAALTKMPCRWHCERQRQDGGIHPRAAGITTSPIDQRQRVMVTADGTVDALEVEAFLAKRNCDT
jgi:hypothetical protein